MIFGHHHQWGFAGFLVKLLVVLGLLGLLVDCAGNLLSGPASGSGSAFSLSAPPPPTASAAPAVPSIAPRRPAP